MGIFTNLACSLGNLIILGIQYKINAFNTISFRLGMANLAQGQG